MELICTYYIPTYEGRYITISYDGIDITCSEELSNSNKLSLECLVKDIKASKEKKILLEAEVMNERLLIYNLLEHGNLEIGLDTSIEDKEHTWRVWVDKSYTCKQKHKSYDVHIPSLVKIYDTKDLKEQLTTAKANGYSNLRLLGE